MARMNSRPIVPNAPPDSLFAQESLESAPDGVLLSGVSPECVEGLRSLVDARLDALVPCGGASSERLNGAMRYCLLAPGKRIRPLLTLLTAMQLGAEARAALDVACAMEMVHAASLILDDLPAMDDAQLRRGAPTVHLRFGEDIAILAAVALLNAAYQTIAGDAGLAAPVRVKTLASLAAAIGSQGLVAGQEADLRDRARDLGASRIDEINHRKTAVLFIAAVEGGAYVAGAADGVIEAARGFARHLGLAFQIADDLLDLAPSPAVSGKDVGRDGGKPTLVSVLGQERAAARLREHLVSARIAAGQLGGRSGPLGGLVALCFPE